MRKQRQEISVERKLEIELELKQKEDIELNTKLSISEIVYYIEAIKMPYQEILDAIKWYDSKKAYVDELELVQHLSQKYNVERDDIINRIQDVRRINNYIGENLIDHFKAKENDSIKIYIKL